MVQTQTTNAGPVGLKPKGAYQSATQYTLLDLVRHGYESWVCTAINQDGTAGTVTGEEPTAAAQHWMALTDFESLIAAVNASAQNADDKATLANTAAGNANTKAALADEKATLANAAAALANEKATLADQKATLAQTQADYAKQQGDRAKETADYPDQIRSDGYVWTYDPDDASAGDDGYRRTAYKVDAALDFDALTPEQYQSLIDNIQAGMVFATAATCESIIDELT